MSRQETGNIAKIITRTEMRRTKTNLLNAQTSDADVLILTLRPTGHWCNVAVDDDVVTHLGLMMKTALKYCLIDLIILVGRLTLGTLETGLVGEVTSNTDRGLGTDHKLRDLGE
jgi:hypothetical protein